MGLLSTPLQLTYILQREMFFSRKMQSNEDLFVKRSKDGNQPSFLKHISGIMGLQDIANVECHRLFFSVSHSARPHGQSSLSAPEAPHISTWQLEFFHLLSFASHIPSVFLEPR